MSARPPDHEARTLAATCFDRNLVVTAGAGSGKTTLLIERLVNACLGRGVPLTRMLAMTFTEKAAAELRDRLAAQLSRSLAALRDGSPAEGVAGRSLEWTLRPVAMGGAGVSAPLARERALQALDDLDAASVGTIHAFCAELLRRHPREARLDPRFVVDDGTRTDQLFEAEWSEYVDRELSEASPHREQWKAVIADGGPPLVRQMARCMLSAGGRSLTSARDRESDDVEALVGARLQSLAEAEALGTNRNIPEWADRTRGLLETYQQDGMSAFRHAASQDSYLEKGVPSAGKGCPSPKDVEAAFKACKRTIKLLVDADEHVLEPALELSRDLALRTLERLRREGVIDFDGLLTAARDLLLDHPDVRRGERERFDMVLLDEFQDTDPVQYEIAFLLGEGGTSPVPAGGSAWKAQLEPGRLFVVGDPKQSIYRFRGADMAACEAAVRAITSSGGLRLALTANFRSRHELIESVNGLCEKLIVEKPSFQPPWEALQAARGDAVAGEPRFEVWSVSHDGRGAAGHRLAEARAIAAEVSSWRASGTIASYGEVAVLLRALTDVQILQRGLAEASIPFVVQGGRSFMGRDEVVQAVQLLRCLVRPHDELALLSVLRSPACGASDVEILRYRQGSGGRWSWRGHESVPQQQALTIPAVMRTLRGLDALARRIEGLPADEAVREVLGGAGERGDAWRPRLLEIHAASHGGAQRVANLEKLVERAAELSREDGLSLAQIADRLGDELREGAPEGESPLADETVDAVRVMSIHHAKGLEFPVVIVPDVARQASGRRDSGTKISVRNGVISIVLSNGCRNLASVVEDDQDALHEEAERSRLVYVAVTRAMERLILVNAHPSPQATSWPFAALRDHLGYDPHDDGWVSRVPGVVHRRLLGQAPELCAPDPVAVTELVSAVLARDASSEAMDRARRGRPRSATGARESREEQLLAVPYEAFDPGFDQPLDARQRVDAGAGPGSSTTPALEPALASALEPVLATALEPVLARAVGIAVHQALEVGLPEDADELARLGARAAQLAAEETGADASAVERETAALLAGLRGSPAATRLAGCEVLARELPFVMRRADGSDWQGFVDLVVRSGGRTIVVDWKTDRVRDPEGHRAQLELYAEAVKAWLGLPARPGMALVYVTDGAWVDL